MADAIIASNKELVFWAAMEECLLVKLAVNLRVAHDNYFYGGFIKKFYTI